MDGGAASVGRSDQVVALKTLWIPALFRYTHDMTTKEMALKTIERLPADVSWEDIQERINFVTAVRKGFRELDDGKGIPHDKVKEESAEWFTE